MTGELIVAEARRWIGTPYRHQTSARLAGCDCLGLLRGVWRAIYGREPVSVPPYTPDWDEVGHTEKLRRAAERYLIEKPVGDLDAGDVILFRMRRGAVAKHLGICSSVGERTHFIHAYSGHGVVESALSEPWCRRVAGVFAFPDAGRKNSN